MAYIYAGNDSLALGVTLLIAIGFGLGLAEINRFMKQLGGWRIACETVAKEESSPEEALEHDPDMGLDNPMFQMMDLPGLGKYPVPSSPVNFEHSGANSAKRAPLLGEHTEEILSSVVGITDTEIAQLFDRGVVAASGK